MRAKDVKVGVRVTNGPQQADAWRDSGTIVSTTGGVHVKWDGAKATYHEDPKKLTLEADEQKLAEYLSGPGGDAELGRDVERAAVLRKQAGVERAGVSKGLLLGYTASGKPVFEPTGKAPNTNNVVTFNKTKFKFPGWTEADHMDASALIEDLAATKTGGDAQRLKRWTSTHWDVGGRWTSPQYDARRKERGSATLGVLVGLSLVGGAIYFLCKRERGRT